MNSKHHAWWCPIRAFLVFNLVDRSARRLNIPQLDVSFAVARQEELPVVVHISERGEGIRGALCPTLIGWVDAAHGIDHGIVGKGEDGVVLTLIKYQDLFAGAAQEHEVFIFEEGRSVSPTHQAASLLTHVCTRGTKLDSLKKACGSKCSAMEWNGVLVLRS